MLHDGDNSSVIAAGDDQSRVVIVGAGHGGTQAAALLRQKGFAGELILLGQEPQAPYNRPPLSKSYITDALAVDDLYLKRSDFYRKQRIDLRLKCQVTEVFPDRKLVRTLDGFTLRYDALILATGAAPRPLDVPGGGLPGVGELRTVADARRLRELVAATGHLVIVGGGYIGLEVAAACRANGVRVTVIEREDRILSRVASAKLSGMLAQYHEEYGTDILVSSTVEELAGGPDGRVSSVMLGNGDTIACDSVLTGIGAMPDDLLAREAGLDCRSGVIVDEESRTSDGAIFAIGDMTRRPVLNQDTLFRLESIPSTMEQAEQAVAAILGLPKPKSVVPWFWSDQFDLRMKMAGLVHEGTSVITRHSESSSKISFFHLQGTSVVAVETVNAPGEFTVGKRLIEKNAPVDPVAIADHSVSLREVVT